MAATEHFVCKNFWDEANPLKHLDVELSTFDQYIICNQEVLEKETKKSPFPDNPQCHIINQIDNVNNHKYANKFDYNSNYLETVLKCFFRCLN